MAILDAFCREVHNQWTYIERRDLGHVGWTPEISVDVFQYKGNIVSLVSSSDCITPAEAKCAPQRLVDTFYTKRGRTDGFQAPYQAPDPDKRHRRSSLLKATLARSSSTASTTD
ncbi:hypothetical protein DACRYDRAFT_109023 [Dacryopinax primogenitus]|uniref:Uncharacterized protein n=1 Tax=Dacryopinax primogenitus (strain DJM 731) TaxID=1858805 RepID=M5FVG6_DACPD|nr:uncharacterized protein DACRYDRAFT_109023 [Dacryopinax primogenitus]EJU00284.1 hypothetical protein DACRYDRAFT_109023 [Dacryopinax primogenitus]